MDEQSDGWLDRWTDKLMGGQADGWTVRWMDSQMDGQSDGWTSRQSDEHRWTDKLTVRRSDIRTDI